MIGLFAVKCILLASTFTLSVITMPLTQPKPTTRRIPTAAPYVRPVWPRSAINWYLTQRYYRRPRARQSHYYWRPRQSPRPRTRTFFGLPDFLPFAPRNPFGNYMRWNFMFGDMGMGFGFGELFGF